MNTITVAHESLAPLLIMIAVAVVIFGVGFIAFTVLAVCGVRAVRKWGHR